MSKAEAELRRVEIDQVAVAPCPPARGEVLTEAMQRPLLGFRPDPGGLRRFWLTRDYLPEVADLIAGRPSVTELAGAIGARLEPVPIPWDCVGGFFEAYWRRPQAYLDENVRRWISVWHPPSLVSCVNTTTRPATRRISRRPATGSRQ